MWSGTVVYDSPNGEYLLRGDDIDRFVEVGQGYWVEQSHEQLEELKRERKYHLDQYTDRLHAFRRA